MDWIFWSIGGGLALAALALVWWALFWDRARDRRRCPKCWYDLCGTPGLVCSECGYVARRECRLRKTRRRWRWAIGAFVLLAGGVVTGKVPRIRLEGWTCMLPTTALILYLPWIDQPETSTALRALNWRLPSPYWPQQARPADWWDWQWTLLIDRCLEGDPQRRPGTDEWWLFYHHLLDCAVHNDELLVADERRSRLAAVFPVTVTVRPTSPILPGRPFRCRMEIHPTWGTSVEYRAVARPNIAGTTPLSAEWFFSFCAIGQSLVGHDEREIVPLRPGTNSVEFQVQVECRRSFGPGEDDKWKPFSSFVVEMPVNSISAQPLIANR